MRNLIFDGTIPIAQFNQGELIDAVIKNMLTNNPKNQKTAERMLAINDGICYMLSMEWLRLIHTNQNGWDTFCLHPKDSKGKLIIDEKDIAYYTQIANNFYQYDEILNGALKRILQRTILEKNLDNCSNFEIDTRLVPLCFGSQNSVIAKKAMEPQKKLASFRNSMASYFIGHTASKLLIGLFGYDGSDCFGHEAAMFHNAGDYYFFDCNYGIFKIQNMDLFLQDFWNTYQIQKIEITELV